MVAMEKAKIYRQRYKDRKLSQGLCPLCGRNPLLPGRKRCGSCREKYIARSIAYLTERRRKLVSQGLCRNCGKPAFTKRDGTKAVWCRDCFERKQHKLRPARGQPCFICGGFKEIVETHHHKDGRIFALCPNHHTLYHLGLLKLPQGGWELLNC